MHIRRLLAGAATAALAVALVLPGTSFAQAGAGGRDGFGDLGHVPWAQNAITALQSQGVLRGVAPGVFDPNGLLQRDEVVVVLGRLDGWPTAAGSSSSSSSSTSSSPTGVNPSSRFHDWSSVPSWARGDFRTAIDRGILDGLPGGYVRPAESITWAQLAVIVDRAFAYPSVPPSQIPGLLSRLPQGPATPSWAQAAVAADVQAGDFSGTVASLYSPDRAVTRAELAVFIEQAARGSGAATQPGAAVAGLNLSPSPIAPSGILAAGQAVSVAVYASGSSGTPVPDATVYISFQAAPGGGTASVAGTALTATPAPFTADASGMVAVTYTAPTTLPDGGTDTLSAANATTAPTATGSDSYTFAATAPTGSGSTGSAVQTLSFAPSPVAPSGSLVAGQAVSVAVYADGSSGAPLPDATVYLSFEAAPGGGTALVDGTALTATPAPFTADASGMVAVIYTAPMTLPDGGTDTLSAANAATAPTATGTDSYTFATSGGTGAGSGSGVGALQLVSGTNSGLSVTVALGGGQTAAYPLAPDVVVTRNGGPGSLSSLAPGDTVTLALNSQGEVTAIDITAPDGGSSGTGYGSGG